MIGRCPLVVALADSGNQVVATKKVFEAQIPVEGVPFKENFAEEIPVEEIPVGEIPVEEILAGMVPENGSSLVEVLNKRSFGHPDELVPLTQKMMESSVVQEPGLQDVS